MRTLITLIGFIFAVLILSSSLQAQERTTDRVWASPNAAVEQQIGLTNIKVTYGRPSVNDREIFGELVPFDSVWRTGANEATAVVFSDDVLIEGERVEAGTYSLYTIPGTEEWKIILNHKLSWGTQYDEAEDLLRVQVQPEDASLMEQMMIYFENVTDTSGDMVIHWASTRAPLHIEVVNN